MAFLDNPLFGNNFTPPQARLRLSNVASTAHGGSVSGETKVINFGTTDETVGGSGQYFTYTTFTTTTGDKITINQSGTWFIYVQWLRGGAGVPVGITVNGSALSTAIQTVTIAQGNMGYAWAGVLAETITVGRILRLEVNDVIRFQDDGNGGAGGNAQDFQAGIVKLF